MTIPHDKPGFSQRRHDALDEARRKADLARCGAKARKDYEARLAAAAPAPVKEGARPKRKRARRAAKSGAQLGAEQDIEWPFSDETIRAAKNAIDRYVVPRMMAQLERREGDPYARPRDFMFDEDETA